MGENILFEKQDYINSVLDFIQAYKRFPYINGDKVVINESLYSADKYMKEFLGSQKDMIKHFLDNGLITYDLISELTGISDKKIKDLVDKKAIRPDTMDRRKIEVFFGVDFYPKEDKYNALCMKCKNKCKQDYWTMVIECAKRKVK